MKSAFHLCFLRNRFAHSPSNLEEHIINTSTEQLAADTASTISPAAAFDRRHDLDALQAITMLLGVVLHR